MVILSLPLIFCTKSFSQDPFENLIRRTALSMCLLCKIFLAEWTFENTVKRKPFPCTFYKQSFIENGYFTRHLYCRAWLMGEIYQTTIIESEILCQKKDVVIFHELLLRVFTMKGFAVCCSTSVCMSMIHICRLRT